MKNILAIISVTILLGSNAYAEHPEHDHSNHSHEGGAKLDGTEGASCKDKVVVSVNGLVCDFCARALEKIFSKKDEVAGIDVDLDKGEVVIAMKEGQSIADDIVKQLVTDSGYNVTAIDKGC